MAKLLMISGDRSLAEGKRGAFYNTLEEFHKYWGRIDIICPRTTNYKLQTTNLFGNVFIHPSPWPLWLQPLWILKKGKRIYKEQKFNLMTAHEYPPFYNGIGARLLWNKIRVPYVLEIHHVPGLPRAANFKEKFYKNITKFFIRTDSIKAKAIRVVNKKQVPDFLIKAGVFKDKIVYIPSFYIDLDIFRPLNLPKDYDLIFVGRLAENKGINLFLKAVKKLNAKTIIVGDGPLKENLKLQGNIRLHGWAKDSAEIAGLLNRSKIIIMSSYNEGGPRVILEAMACGVSVLATPVGIVPDIIKDGESGRIIEWDAGDIAKKAAELLNDEDKRRNFGLNGLNIVQQFEKKGAIKNYAQRLQDFITL